MLRCSGFILLGVLVFLQIFSSLTAFALIEMINIFKTNEATWQTQRFLIVCQGILHAIQAEFVTALPACTIPVIAAATLSQQPLAWWQQVACRQYVGKDQFYYVIESLGHDACAIVDGNTKTTADYYRITLLALPNAVKNAKILLQNTWVEGSVSTEKCSEPGHRVQPGSQMQREI